MPCGDRRRPLVGVDAERTLRAIQVSVIHTARDPSTGPCLHGAGCRQVCPRSLLATTRRRAAARAWAATRI